MGYFQEQEFQERMIALMIRDQKFLQRISGLLSPDDFTPQKDEGLEATARQWVATTCLKYWEEYKQPIGGMLKVEAMDYIRQNRTRLGAKYRQLLMGTIEKVRDPELGVAVEAIEKKIIQYKQRQKFKFTIEELIRLQSDGELNPKTFRKLTKNAIVQDEFGDAVDYGETLEQRIKRRDEERGQKLPALYIDCFDEAVSTAPRGQVAMALAKYGTGKSTFMVHIAKAYALQGLNVLFYTLEDPVPSVENRLDASLADMLLMELGDKPKTLRKRFREEWELMKAKIKIVNATGGGWTVQRMADYWEAQRNRGYIADLVIVDYDKKIEPVTRYKGDSAVWMQSSDIYIDLTNWAARDQIFMWVAAQAKRGKSKKPQVVVTGDDAAEDINKLRETALCLGIGYGPEDFEKEELYASMRYLFVAKHRFDQSMMGWPIVGDLAKGMFYDVDKSRKLLARWDRMEGKLS